MAFRLLSIATFMAAANAAQVTMTAYFKNGLDSPSCLNYDGNATVTPPIIAPSTFTDFDWTEPYNPSCIELINFFASTPTESNTPAISSCYTDAAAMTYAQKIGLFDRFASLENFTYGDPTATPAVAGTVVAFEINSCSDGDATFALYRKPSDTTEELANQCYGFNGISVDNTLIPSIKGYEGATLSFSDLNVKQTGLPLVGGTKVYEYDVSSSLSIDGVTYTLDRVASGFSKMETSGNTTEEVNIFSQQTIPSKLSYILPSTTTGKPQQLAQSIDVVLGSTFVTLTMNRNLTATPASKILKVDDISVLSCDVKYTVTRKTGGRSFGPWLELKEDGVSKSGLSRSSVGKLIGSGVVDTGYGYDRIFDLIDDGCIKTCTSSMTMWLPSTVYNPYYSPETLGPLNINSRCYGGSDNTASICPFPFIVSDYQGTDCLCGQMDLLSFSTDYNKQTGIGPLQARITLTTLDDNSISNMFTNITVTSGSALGSSSVQPTTLPSLIGGAVGGILATAVAVGVFFVFSKPLGDSSKSKGASLVAKTTTPLAGVQMIIIFISVACSIGSIFSPEAFTVVQADASGNGAYNTFNIGLFHLLSTDGNIGTNAPAGSFATLTPPSQEPYPCAFTITGMASSGGEGLDFQYQAGCNAARAGSVVSAVGGIAALVLCYFQRQKLALPCIIVAAIGSFIMLGAFKVSVIDGWLSTVVPESTEAYYGSAYSIMVVTVFFYIVAIVAWVIDSLSMEEA